MVDAVAALTPPSPEASATLASQLALEYEAELFGGALDQATAIETTTAPAESAPPPSADSQAWPSSTVTMNGAQTTSSTATDNGYANDIWRTLMSVDEGYRNLFPLPVMGGSQPGSAMPSAHFAAGAAEHASVSAADLQSIMLRSVEVSLWSVQVNLLTSGVKRTTDGVQTLFRNSG